MLRRLIPAVAASILGFASASSAASVWTEHTQIVSVIALEGSNILRVQVSSAFLANPAGCTVGPDTIDLQLDVPNRSLEEQRQLMNAINVAFMTRRNVQFYVRDDLCSTAATSARIRIAVGVRVFN